MPKTMSHVEYVAVAKASGEQLCEPTSYRTAAMIALWEEAVRGEAIKDVAFETPEACAAAVADTRCGVMHARSTVLTSELWCARRPRWRSGGCSTSAWRSAAAASALLERSCIPAHLGHPSALGIYAVNGH